MDSWIQILVTVVTVAGSGAAFPVLHEQDEDAC
jgi:hypothetical protein